MMAPPRGPRRREATPAAKENVVPPIYMEGVEYFQCRYAPPFVTRPPLGENWLLYRIDGQEVVLAATDAQRTTVTLEIGAIVALSGLLRHQFSSAGSGQIQKPWREEVFTGKPAPGEALITVGRISKSQMTSLPMYERLLIIQPSEHPEMTARLGAALHWIADEMTRPGVASKEIIRRLAEITTVEIGRFEDAMKTAANRANPKSPADLRIIKAISAFYSAPQEPWSVQRLAEVAGMSRTAFAVRYRALIGATPLRTIRQLRMQIAKNQLQRPLGYSTLESLAKSAGYGSQAAFIRAFAKEFGMTPGKTRLEKSRF